jgi:hypothetical protein
MEIVPMLLRCDRGTENSTLSLFQPFFSDKTAQKAYQRLKSYMYRKSVANQRLESR